MFVFVSFSCVNICLVPWKLFEHEDAGRVFIYLPRDLTDIDAMKQTCNRCFKGSSKSIKKKKKKKNSNKNHRI